MCNIICQLEPDEGPATLRTSFYSGNFMTLLAILKLQVRLFLSIAISKHLNAAPYLQHKSWQLLREETVPAYLTHDFTCALVSLPDQWLWSLVWEWDYVCTCVHQKMASYATDSNRAELRTVFFDQGEFVAMNTLSGYKVLRCDKHQFRDKTTMTF